jgi:hypothetical protein
MTNIPILHAWTARIESEPPYRVLYVWTDLPAKPETPGFNAEAKRDMQDAIGKIMSAAYAPDCYVVHSPDDLDGNCL